MSGLAAGEEPEPPEDDSPHFRRKSRMIAASVAAASSGGGGGSPVSPMSPLSPMSPFSPYTDLASPTRLPLDSPTDVRRASVRPEGGGAASDVMASYSKNMLAAASKINTQVLSLYKTSTVRGGGGDSSHDNSPAHFSGELGDDHGPGAGGAGQEDADGAGSESGGRSQGSEGSTAREEDDHQSDSGSDVFDFVAAAGRVNFLLDSLKAEKRTDLMDQLNDWYEKRVETVDVDRDALMAIEEEHRAREDGMKDNMKQLLQSLEEKQMREVKVLMQAHATMHEGVRNKTRMRFSAKSVQMPAQAASSKDKKGVKKKRVKKGKEGAGRMDGGEPQEATGEAEVANEAGTAEAPPEDQAGDQSEWEEDVDSEEDVGEDGEGGDAIRGGEPVNVLQPIDVDKARKLLKTMQEAPQKVLSTKEDPAPVEILTSLSIIQEGQKELERQATLARMNCDLLKAAVEHLNHEDPRAKEDAPSQAVHNVIKQVRVEVFGTESEERQLGPDPEELEDECRSLEELIQSQERDIEDYKKQQARNRKVAIALQSKRAQHKMEGGREGGGDGDEDEQEPEEEESRKGPVVQRSQMMDARLGAIAAASGQVIHVGGLKDPKAKAANLAKSISATSRRTDENVSQQGGARGDGDQAMPGVGEDMLAALGYKLPPAVDSDPRVDELRQRIDEKDALVGRAKRLLHRMRGEYALLHYCAQKAEAGIESIVEEYQPPVAKPYDENELEWQQLLNPTSFLDDLMTPFESPAQSKDDVHKESRGASEGRSGRQSPVVGAQPQNQQKATAEGQPAPHTEPRKTALQQALMEKAGFVEKKPDDRESVKEEVHGSLASKDKAAEESCRTKGTKNNAGKTPGKSAGLRSQRSGKGADSGTQGSKGANADEEEDGDVIKQVEVELQGKVRDLQAQVAQDTTKIKIERLQQKNLKKEIVELKKRYKAMVKNDRNAPASVDALNKQVDYYKEAEDKLKTQITDMQEELNTQSRILERVQSDVQEKEEQRISRMNLLPSAQPMLPAGQSSHQGGVTASADNTAPLPASADGSSGLTPVTEEVKGSAGRPSSSANTAVGAGAASAATTDVEAGTGAGSGAGTAAHDSNLAAGVPGAAAPGASALGAIEPGAVGSEAPARGAAGSGSVPSAGMPGRFGAAAAVGERVGNPLDAEANKGKSQRTFSSDTPAGSNSQTMQRLASDKSSKSNPAPQANAAQEEFMELVKLQSKNEEIKAEIDDIVRKMQHLKKLIKQGKGANMSQDQLREIVGIAPEAEEIKPPPEYFQLKREVRLKQNEVRNLRKRWWRDHKDLEAIVDRVKQSTGEGRSAGTMMRSTTKSTAAPQGSEPELPQWLQGLAQQAVQERGPGREGHHQPHASHVGEAGEAARLLLGAGQGGQSSSHLGSGGDHPSGGSQHGRALRRGSTLTGARDIQGQAKVGSEALVLQGGSAGRNQGKGLQVAHGGRGKLFHGGLAGSTNPRQRFANLRSSLSAGGGGGGGGGVPDLQIHGGP